MCGLAGFMPFEPSSSEAMKSISVEMANAIFSRGPDDQGVWVEDNNTLAMSFRRLAILDLSPAGKQPMESISGRYHLCFNGEIYNHLDLRKNLKKDWIGRSDTETILQSIEEQGLELALQSFVGMFALAVWDSRKRELTLARDRMGEKPLYYGWVDNAFIFASELKAIKKHPNFNNQISTSALSNYLKFNYVPAPQSIYKDIYKLEPGTFISIPYQAVQTKTIKTDQFWNLASVISKGCQDPITDYNEGTLQTKAVLSEAVKSQMISDVPLGAFLSGGIDSSLITSIMQENSIDPIKTFTIGFEDSQFDESQYAKKVAKHLGTNHSEYFVTSNEALEVIPSLPQIYDEPFADSSQIPTYLVCKQAKQSVTVALSGDGGDEIFGGYNRYFWSSKIWSKIQWMPHHARQFIGAAGIKIPQNALDRIEKIYNFSVPKNIQVHQFADKVAKLSSRLQFVATEDDLYESLITQWNDPSVIMKEHNDTDIKPPLLSHDDLRDHLPSRMMLWDSLTYLPDDILCKVDRAAMSVSLETRTPFLDHRLVELAWRLPHSFKLNNSQGKLILREILNDYVPKNLIDRPKAGFCIPVGDWLRGPLRCWAEELIREDKINTQGFFYYDPIIKTWNEHLSNSHDHTHKLWSILMFQSWLEAQ